MKVAIAGYGQEGEASLRYWQARDAEITVFDEQQPEDQVPDGIKTYFGEDAWSKLNGFDIVVRTPSLSPNKISTDGKIWSATNEFFAKCPAPIIGVTGTKGKGTTASLITEILKAAEETVYLLGNIGIPALTELPKIQPSSIVVYELSSFQLWDLEKSPETAVVLMIEPDHMDIHASMEEYIAAKANIGRYQTKDNLMIYHPNNAGSAQIAARSPAHKIKYLTDQGAYIQDGQILISDQTICSVSEVGLVGEHNLENICAAITAAWPYTQNIAAVKNAVTSFTGLPHRLEFVAEVNGVKFYDDSIATNEGSVRAAVKSFEQPKILIMGGAGKGVRLASLFNQLAQENVKKLILLGELADSFASLAKENGIKYQIIRGTMREVVQAAYNAAEVGEVVLLSPAATSYDMFKNYKERGDRFKDAVKALA